MPKKGDSQKPAGSKDLKIRKLETELLSLKADYLNSQRRLADTLAKSAKDTQVELLKQVIPLLDTLQLAFQNHPADIEDHQWVQGVLKLKSQIPKILAEFQLEVIYPLKEKFDPHFMEAVASVEDTKQASGTVIEVLQSGYLHGETVIKPALVRVAK